jgi:hypothetical protein
LDRFDLKKLNEVEDKDRYRVEISNRFTALQNSDTEVGVSKAWESIRDNIEIAAKRF